MIHPRRLAHFNLYVSNLEAATRFYNDICGVRYIAGEPHIPIRFFTNGSTHHEFGLIELRPGDRIGRDGFVQGTTTPGQKPGLNHLGWEMENEALLVEAWRRLGKAGVKMRPADHTIAHSVYIADPDGNYHEFFADTPLNWHEYLQGDLPPMTGRWDPEAAEPQKEGYYPKNPQIGAVEDAPVHPLKPSHGVMRANDLQSFREFFVKTAGLQEVTASREDGFAMFKGNATHGVADLIVLQGRAPDEGPLHHMAFAMRDVEEVDRSLERLSRAGHRPVRMIDSASKRGFVLADPDGLLIEFSAPKPGKARATTLSAARDVYELA